MSTATLEVPFDANRLACSAARPLEACAEFRIGVRSVPYLADHGFQGMAVLPGSFYIELALRVDRGLSRRAPGFVRNVTFHNPIILSAGDTVIKVEVRDHGDRRVEYAFYEGSVEDRGDRTPSRQCAATLEIDRSPSPPASAGTDAFSIESFQAQSHAVIGADRFYAKLRENGNQYGPGFQKVSSIWRAGDQVLGRLSVVREDRELAPTGMHPSLLDSVVQLLATFIAEKGKTFVLRSIEKVEVMDLDFPATLWGHAVLLHGAERDGKSVTGNVRVFDESGKPHLELSGVTLTFLDSADTPGERAAANLVIASTFTAEPIEDALKFWGDHFGVAVHLEFTPYNQVLQQLLDKGSALRRNRDGFNVILLGLEDWAAQDQHGVVTLSRERAEQCFGERARCMLPNGMEIAHLHRYETDYLYREIFEDGCYERHGIRLHDGDTVVDIGANIGLFSLYVMSRCRNPRIFAFEPAPVVYDLLKANCEAYGSTMGATARALNLGVSDKAKTAALTFYEKSSVFSGFHADESEDREAIKAIVRNMLNSETSVRGEALEGYVDELTADRLHHRIQDCRMTTVSDLIREHQLDHIDLLKIDAEKSELDIVRGIEDGDWAKIDQIVIEIHDRTRETVRQIEDLLIGKGYRCALDHEKTLERSGLFNLYASRHQADEGIAPRSGNAAAVDTGTSRARRVAGCLQRNIDDFCAALASLTNHATAPVVLCVCPRTPAADADPVLTAALEDAERTLLSRARAIPNVHTIGSAAPLQSYPVEDYYDAHSHHLGQIPYAPECYAAIGTALFRTIFNLKRNPFKVIVLDCDNTLWKGVCGEDGHQGIEVSAPYRGLQEFMIAQMNAGMLLCLCSRNSEQDVLDVFDRRTDMALRREHLVAWRINWNSKSANIKSLAKELNLGLDSFIFVDDNPVDCADVRVNCPGVLALQLPPDSASFPSFLNHAWAFDHAGGKQATEEDRGRTRMYREASERQRFREQTFSLKDFVRELQLRIEIADATDDQLGRVSQLTYRTNQFNFTTIRRSENEIRDFLRRKHAGCLAVRVADRFGDYGLVGVVMYETEADRLKVDTLLLSCRVLGRGVEHAILSRLGQQAAREHKGFVELTFRPTAKNLPAMAFVESIGARYGNAVGSSWIFSAERLLGLEYNPDETAHDTLEDEVAAAPTPDTSARRPASGFGAFGRSEPLQRIAEGLYRIDLLAKAIEQHRLAKEPPQVAVDVAPGSALQTALLGIWRKVLGRPHIGINDNFLEAGGTSLRAVQVIAIIQKELNQNLSIVSLFECPTVRLLAARLSASGEEPRSGTHAAEAALRGQQRRSSMVKRRAS